MYRDRGGRGRERERQGRKKKNYKNTKKFMEFYLVVLHSAERSEARQPTGVVFQSGYPKLIRNQNIKKLAESQF